MLGLVPTLGKRAVERPLGFKHKTTVRSMEGRAAQQRQGQGQLRKEEAGVLGWQPPPESATQNMQSQDLQVNYATVRVRQLHNVG